MVSQSHQVALHCIASGILGRLSASCFDLKLRVALASHRDTVQLPTDCRSRFRKDVSRPSQSMYHQVYQVIISAAATERRDKTKAFLVL
ncbi:hypothetical protein BJY01DRAFT_209092 [Aspergillus pseudoustus]|uniref:Uncharacterized protein n=1 Tax=Aspergillus pseudoustus TaxID=1810923 RepID=A0ABR4KGT3_9EURO